MISWLALIDLTFLYQDLIGAMKHISVLKNAFNEMRADADSIFANLFEKCSELANCSIPRRCQKQRNRPNIETENPEEYFRITIFLPLLDDIIEQINGRFSRHNQNSLKLSYLLPSKISKASSSSITETFTFYKKFFPNKSIEQAEGEFDVWKAMWPEEDNNPEDALSALDHCDGNAFPIIRKLLLTLATQPVSTASPERSFSTLRRLKTWLRNRMKEERLSALALMAIHRDKIDFGDASQILELFSASKSRKLNILL